MMEVIEISDDDDSLPAPSASADSADDDDIMLSSPGSPGSTSSSSSAPPSPSRKETDDQDDVDHCQYCGQNAPILCPEVHPSDRAHREMMALRDDRLQLAETDEDDKPTCHLSHFYVFDEAGHLVDLASTMVEEGKLVYFTGRLYPIDWSKEYSEDVGVKVVRGGPIKQWWNFESAIGITTDKADYYMKTPAGDYKRIYSSLLEKTELTETIKNMVNDAMNAGVDLQYQAMIDKLAGKDLDGQLLEHGETVLKFLWDYDQAADDDEERQLTSAPALKKLASEVSFQFKKKKRVLSVSGEDRGARYVPRRRMGTTAPPTVTKATVTPLVEAIFEGFFKDQLEDTGQKDDDWSKRRCGTCSNCLKPDCGKCKGCKKMTKFTGSKQIGKAVCLNRPCQSESQQDVVLVDEVDCVDPEKSDGDSRKKTSARFAEEDLIKSVSKATSGSVVEFFDKVFLGIDGGARSEYLSPGDFVTVRPDLAGVPHFYAQILALTREEDRGKELGVAHVRWMCRSVDTILGNDSEDENELFAIGMCEDIMISEICDIVEVELVKADPNWNMLGGTKEDAEKSLHPSKKLFYRFVYESSSARFTCLDERQNQNLILKASKGHGCRMCAERNKSNKEETPILKEEEREGVEEPTRTVLYMGERYKKHDAVFVDPSVLQMPFQDAEKDHRDRQDKKRTRRLLEKEGEERTEFYRINPESRPLGFTENEISSPFRVCVIEKITPTRDENGKTKIWLRVRIMFRPEDVDANHLSRRRRNRYDINEVFWASKTRKVDATKLRGKVHLLPEQLVPEPKEEWKSGSSNRFYFSQIYDLEEGFKPVPKELIDFFESKDDREFGGVAPQFSPPERPLRSFEVFAGCGGLSEGLEQSGVSKAEWAIEFYQPAAEAFKKNHKDCQVIVDDCNAILTNIMCGEQRHKGVKLPRKGEVELMSGGPPCQGYSLLNSFSEGEYSQLKNSQVASYLAYADYFRPRFFIMENVKNFASYKKGLILKLCLRALVRIGYQCTFGILQAGNFGVPQNRRRCFLLAAAPDEVLPRFPEPRHVFSTRGLNLTHTVDERLYHTGVKWTDCAPFRATTIRDAISDLPILETNNSNSSSITKSYLEKAKEEQTAFQRQLRKRRRQMSGGENDVASGKWLDHTVKPERPLIQARIEQVPTDVLGADWRLIPNKKVKLSDGSTTNVLDYRFETKDGNKAVCLCQDHSKTRKRRHSRGKDNKRCSYDLKYKGPGQEFTLIPWRLPHTADNHNQWAGLYGRVPWDGFFCTVVTEANPESKQGQVLHPDQHRIVSVRECARSQGFSDDYQFAGTIKDKYRQIGNAVPPPLARALGDCLSMALRKNCQK